jgi:hypothetical protein
LLAAAGDPAQLPADSIPRARLFIRLAAAGVERRPLGVACFFQLGTENPQG